MYCIIKYMNKKDLPINEKFWRNMSSDELDCFVDEIFCYYRENGFPYQSTDSNYRVKEFTQLKNFDYTSVLKNNIVGQTMHGLGLAWSYFPHAYSVKSCKPMSPYDAFIDDDIFKAVIRRRLSMGTYISDAGILKMLRIFTGVQGVSNFRPTAAAAIYNKYAPNGCVWDMSGGWGGRMLGAIVAGVDTYICNEPSTKTRQGLLNLANDFGGETFISITSLGSEEYKPPKDSLDLCFTSPPYFDLEKYSDESTQSYIKFKTKQEWIEGFLRPTIENAYNGLKQGKYLLLNIADPKGKGNLCLEDETIRIAKEIGFEYEGFLKLALSNVKMSSNREKYKYEPIFKFIKP